MPVCITFETIQDIKNINCHKTSNTSGKILVSPLVKQGGKVKHGVTNTKEGVAERPSAAFTQIKQITQKPTQKDHRARF
jgi:hypothetical protein